MKNPDYIGIKLEIITLLTFCIVLVSCIIFNISIVFAMIIGLCIFCAYVKIKKYTWVQLIKMTLTGVKRAKNILITFVLIGMLTALWRSSGTIPTIICGTIQFIHPNSILLIIFLLNCAVSMLTGTSFGTAATIGVICMTVAVSMQINPVLAGGAILSGVFFGDRCSPVSTSALLVSDLTETNIFKNIKLMLLTALVPFLLSCVIYAIIGLSFTHAIMWPAIWPLSIHNLGKNTKLASAFLIMAIVGGAILPLIYGAVSDRYGPQIAYSVMLLGYLYLILFAATLCKINKWK